MSKATTPTLRPFHEIPNPQVLDSAKQFHNAYSALITMVPGSGVLLAALHCASIALELYLKSLSAKEVELPDSTFPDLVFVHAQTAANSHRLEKLFDLAPADFQTALDAEVGKQPGLSTFVGARAALAARNPMFMASRYIFEAERTLDGIELSALGELLAAVARGIASIPGRHVS